MAATRDRRTPWGALFGALRLSLRVGHALLIVAALLTIAASAGVLVWFALHEERAARVTVGQRPLLLDAPVDLDALRQVDDYALVLGIAHNAGDSVPTTRAALANDAGAIEVDVISIGGRLYAAHDTPWPVFERRAFRGPSLDDVWALASDSPVVALDLKESSPWFIDAVTRFLEERQDDDAPAVIVSTPSASALRQLREQAPDAVRVLSVGSRERLAALRASPELLALVDGVSIRHDLLDATAASWLRDQRLLVIAWTVNDFERVNELVELGVHAVTTDNLAILAFLGTSAARDRLVADAEDRRVGSEQAPQAAGEDPDQEPEERRQQQRPRQPYLPTPEE